MSSITCSHNRQWLRGAILAAVWLPSIVSAAEDTGNYCQDSAVNRHWQQAISEHQNDPVVVKLYAMRRGLCEMLAEKKIDAKSARFMWDQAVISALVDKGREATQGGGLLRLFGTF